MHWHLSNAPRWIAALSLAGQGLLVVFADVGTAGHQRPIERLLAERKRESSAASMLARGPAAHAPSVGEGGGCEGGGVFLGRRVVLQCRFRYFTAGVSATRNTGAGGVSHRFRRCRVSWHGICQ